MREACRQLHCAAACLIGACTILNLSKTRCCSATKESASRGSLWVGAAATIRSIGGLVLAIAGAPFAAILPLTVIMRCLQGASSGAFNSAGMCAVKNYAAADQQLYVVGLFTAMFMACNLWASALGELNLHCFGSTAFLLLAALPVLLALG
jgi:hypothetical protein